MKPIKKTSSVSKNSWGNDDDYLVVNKFQVDAEEGFREGDEVEVTIVIKSRLVPDKADPSKKIRSKL